MDWLLTFADPTIDWNYAMVTLVVRFIGVFVVMFVMQIALQVSSYAVQRVESRGAAAAAGGVAVPPAVKAGEPADPTPALSDEATAAAIGLALAIEMRAAASPAAAAAPSSWAVAGRLTQLNRLPR